MVSITYAMNKTLGGVRGHEYPNTTIKRAIKPASIPRGAMKVTLHLA
jgi:hypothetical protein